MDFVIAETFQFGGEALVATEAIRAAGPRGGRHARDPPRPAHARGLDAGGGVPAARRRRRGGRRAQLHPRAADDAAAAAGDPRGGRRARRGAARPVPHARGRADVPVARGRGARSRSRSTRSPRPATTSRTSRATRSRSAWSTSGCAAARRRTTSARWPRRWAGGRRRAATRPTCPSTPTSAPIRACRRRTWPSRSVCSDVPLRRHRRRRDRQRRRLLAEPPRRATRSCASSSGSSGHGLGASEDHSRIIRLGYHSAAYTALTPSAYAAWREVEAESGVRSCTRPGWSTSRGAGARGPRSSTRYTVAMDEAGIGYERFDAAELMRRWPQFRVSDDHEALYQPDGGILDIRKAGAVHVALARARGATVLGGAGVTRDRAGARRRPADDRGRRVRGREGGPLRGRVDARAAAGPRGRLADPADAGAGHLLRDAQPRRLRAGPLPDLAVARRRRRRVLRLPRLRRGGDEGGAGPRRAGGERGRAPVAAGRRARAARRALRGVDPPGLHGPGAVHALLPV